MRFAAIQHDITWEDRDATLPTLEPLIERAAAGGADLIAVTEMFATGFSMRTEVTAEPLAGPTIDWLQTTASHHGVVLAGSLALSPPPDAHDQRPTNTLLVVGPDGVLARYDKRHPFSYGGEDEVFRAGDERVVLELEGLRIGLSVCYDLRFADLYWDREPPVDVELVVANWPAARRAHWQALLTARAIENQVAVVGVNRVGSSPTGLTYAGDSMIIDPLGATIAAAAGQPAVLEAELSAEMVAEVRQQLPFRADRRPRIEDPAAVGP